MWIPHRISFFFRFFFELNINKIQVYTMYRAIHELFSFYSENHSFSECFRYFFFKSDAKKERKILRKQ